MILLPLLAAMPYLFTAEVALFTVGATYAISETPPPQEPIESDDGDEDSGITAVR